MIMKLEEANTMRSRLAILMAGLCLLCGCHRALQRPCASTADCDPGRVCTKTGACVTPDVAPDGSVVAEASCPEALPLPACAAPDGPLHPIEDFSLSGLMPGRWFSCSGSATEPYVPNWVGYEYTTHGTWYYLVADPSGNVSRVITGPDEGLSWNAFNQGQGFPELVMESTRGFKTVIPTFTDNPLRMYWESVFTDSWTVFAYESHATCLAADMGADADLGDR